MSGGTTASSSSERPRFSLADKLFIGLLAAVLLGFLAQRLRVGLRFPVPWPDEGSFLWPALGFRDYGTLFAPEIKPDREVLWMPPGFMIVEGLVFRVVKFSLERARFLSALFLVGAFGALGATIFRYRMRFGHVALMALVLLGCPTFAVVGNVARMESLVLLVVSVGFFLLHRGRTAALGVLLLGPIVHPNGAFPLLGGCLLWALLPREARRTSRNDWVVVALGVVACAAYGVHILSHWDWFVADIGGQLRFKTFVSMGEGGPRDRALQPSVVVSALGLALSAVAARRFGVKVAAPVVLAASLLVQTVTTAGWLYEVYAAYAALIAALVGLEIVVTWFDRSSPSEATRRTGPVFATLVVGALCAGLVVRSAFITRSLDRATISRPTLDPEYLTATDQAKVRAFLVANTPTEGVLAVQFVPDAEALIYEDVRSPHLRFVQQTFYEARADIVVAHDSVWFPRWIRELQILKMFFMHRSEPRAIALHVRNGTERWVVFDWRGPPRQRPEPGPGAVPASLPVAAPSGLLPASSGAVPAEPAGSP